MKPDRPGATPMDTSTGGKNDLTGSQPEHVTQTIEEVIELERQDEASTGRSERLARLVTNSSGSMPYVWLHFTWFGLWLLVNGALGLTFDEYPFGLLTTIVSLEAIFLSIFVLISQNRQALLADKRARVNTQVNLIAEREITKLVAMMADVQEALGIARGDDKELEEMRGKTPVEALADAAEAPLEGDVHPKEANGEPKGADG